MTVTQVVQALRASRPDLSSFHGLPASPYDSFCSAAFRDDPDIFVSSALMEPDDLHLAGSLAGAGSGGSLVFAEMLLRSKTAYAEHRGEASGCRGSPLMTRQRARPAADRA